MGGTAPDNQLRLSFTGSEDGEAETETCRAAKPLWRTTPRTSGPRVLNSLNRRMRTRMYGGVAGEDGNRPPLSRFLDGLLESFFAPVVARRRHSSSGVWLTITDPPMFFVILHQCCPIKSRIDSTGCRARHL